MCPGVDRHCDLDDVERMVRMKPNSYNSLEALNSCPSILNGETERDFLISISDKEKNLNRVSKQPGL